MELYVMRHGETPWNKARKVQGSTDIPLNEQGEALARLTGECMKTQGITFDRVYTSDLIRARRTAELVAEHTFSGEILIEPRVREINFGPIEGQPIEYSADREHHENQYFCFHEPQNYVPKEDGETFADVHTRVRNFLEECIYPLENEKKRVLVVCHGGILRTFLSIAQKKELKDFWEVHQPNCCINLFKVKGGRLQVEKIGMTYYEE